MGSARINWWEECHFRTSPQISPHLPVAQKCEKYGMRAVYNPRNGTCLIGSGDTLYGSVWVGLYGRELEEAILELFVTGPFGVT